MDTINIETIKKLSFFNIIVSIHEIKLLLDMDTLINNTLTWGPSSKVYFVYASEEVEELCWEIFQLKSIKYHDLISGMTPLLAASVTGHTHIVEYLISRTDLVSRKDKIDALELLGATYVDKKRDMLGALRFWKMAMSERYVHLNVCLMICDTAMLHVPWLHGTSIFYTCVLVIWMVYWYSAHVLDICLVSLLLIS